MNIFFQSKHIIFIFLCLIASSVFADNLGRIFTTAEDRQKLEKIRHTKVEVKKEEIEIEVAPIEPIIVKKEIIMREPITLRGLVHRSDGKSTAWVNDSNTFEGDYDSQVIQVPGDKIDVDQVTIIMPDDSSEVELRVGDVFTPEPIEKDVAETVRN